MAAEATTWFWRRGAAGTEERRRETVVGGMMVDLRPENVGKETEGRVGWEEGEEEEEPWRGTDRARIAWERVREEDEAMALCEFGIYGLKDR